MKQFFFFISGNLKKRGNGRKFTDDIRDERYRGADEFSFGGRP